MLQSHACYPLQTVPIPPHPRLLRPSQYNSKQFLATSLKLAFSQCINVIPGQQTVTKINVHKLSPSVRDSGGQCSSHMEVRRLGRHKRDEVVENVVLPGRTSRARDLEVLLIDAQCKWALGNRVYQATHCAARLCRAWQGRGAFVAPITRQLPYSCWPVTPTGRHITEPCFPFCSTLQSATT